MNLIENIHSPHIPPRRTAAMFYKTEPFYSDVSRWVHTNNWEIARAIEILTARGFLVDLIDRNNDSWVPAKKYDLFLGLGVGNSGKHFARYSRASGAKISILLSMGMQPDISNRLVLKRYKMFHDRTGHYAPPKRTVDDVTGAAFMDIIDAADVIFNIGEKGNESYNSYLPYNLPIYSFYPSISPDVKFKPEWLETRSLDEYLCFAGNGLICKGVDVVLEAFLRMPDKRLHICGPIEAAFFEYYGPKIKSARNITYHGFIQPGGTQFDALASICSYAIFHSASEGCCTSVATALRAGLVPVVNSRTGHLIGDSGFTMSDSESNDIIDTIVETVTIASCTPKNLYNDLIDRTIVRMENFSQRGYTESYSAAIDEVLRGL